jgi:UDP-3-O-[3-hydroxymyristoyl] glucosamine N-acyltransferase
VPAGARWGGIPAKPAKQWFREMLLLEKLARRSADEPNRDAGKAPEGRADD